MNRKNSSEQPKKKSTRELETILGSTHPGNFETFYEKNKDDMISTDNPFGNYLKQKLKEKGLSQQQLFIRADIPEGYGYKLLTGEKRTRQRDIIFRLCYAAQLTLEETQKGMALYGLPTLYARSPRDALLMVCLNNRPGGIIEVNQTLRKNHFDALRTSGVQE